MIFCVDKLESSALVYYNRRWCKCTVISYIYCYRASTVVVVVVVVKGTFIINCVSWNNSRKKLKPSHQNTTPDQQFQRLSFAFWLLKVYVGIPNKYPQAVCCVPESWTYSCFLQGFEQLSNYPLIRRAFFISHYAGGCKYVPLFEGLLYITLNVSRLHHGMNLAKTCKGSCQEPTCWARKHSCYSLYRP